jgi:hypothetical protein
MTGAERQPRFSMLLTYNEGEDAKKVMMGIEDVVMNEWVIFEFNSSKNAVTLAKDGKFLVLRRGIALPLP